MTGITERLKTAIADRYRIERELGAGGMATVYLAHDLKHNRKVALKVLRPELAAVVGADRFLREIEVTANLQHPHILPLFDSGEADGFLFYVMPYVEGESLRDRLVRDGPLPLIEAVRMIREVADALAYAHSRGVVHRDIKPDNVMLSGRHATVTDFGVARAVSEAAGREGLTTAGMTVGTPAYMAPEQVAADPDVDHRADIYALGILGYELLAGAPPFADRTPQQVLAAHVTERPPPISSVRPDTPPALADIVTRCLAKEPGDRWAGADEIVRRLEALETPDGGTAAVRAVFRKPRHLGAAVLATIVVLVLIGFGVLRRAPAPPVVSSAAVAVFPFAVRGGPDLQYLGEGMVNLLARSLDGAGDLRSVDPRAVIAQVHREGLETVAPERAAQIARGLGAGLFILGDIVQAGDRIRLDAALYDQRQGLEPVGSGTIDGDPADILGMVDQVAAQLLASGAAPGSRVTQIAAVTTSSLPALKAYLEGESAFRAGRFAAAVEAFESAINADSQFALAFYRLSIAAEWALRPDVARTAAEGAVRHADRLSDHDRRLLEALLATRRGAAGEAERMFRAIVGIWPQDVDAWFELGEVLFHYGPLRGAPIASANEAFERVLSFEPDHVPSLVHLQRTAARRGDTVALDTLGRRILELNPEGDRGFEAAGLRALVAGDSADLHDLRSQILRAPEILATQAAFSASIWTDEFVALRRLIATETAPSRSNLVRALGHIHLAYLEALRGRWAAARAEFTTAESLDQALGLEHRALLLLQPFVPASRAELESLRDVLATWDADGIPPSPIPVGHLTIHDDVHPGLRWYLLGLLHVRLGDLPAATAMADELERATGASAARELYRGLAHGVQAAVVEAHADPAAALQILGDLEEFGNYQVAVFSPFFSRAADRYRRAVLLDTLGLAAAAARAYRSFEDFNFFDRVFAAPSALRAGRLAEREGRLADARRHYERFLFLWSEADTVFRPMLDEARHGHEPCAGWNVNGNADAG